METVIDDYSRIRYRHVLALLSTLVSTFIEIGRSFGSLMINYSADNWFLSPSHGRDEFFCIFTDVCNGTFKRVIALI